VQKPKSNEKPYLEAERTHYDGKQRRVRIRIMVFNATFNNISAISWRPFSWVEEIGAPGENHRPVASP